MAESNPVAELQRFWRRHGRTIMKVFKKIAKAQKHNAPGKGGLFSACFGGGASHGKPTADQHGAAGYAPPPQQPAYVPAPPPQHYPPAPGGYAAAATAGAFVPTAPPAPVAPPAVHMQVPAGGVDPTPAELADVTLAGQRIYDLDDGRLVNGRDYTIRVGSGKKAYDTTTDAAPDKLFSFVDRGVLQRPTYRLLNELRDNYNATTGAEETESAQERQEVLSFLDAIIATRPMQYAHKYLAAKGLMSPDPAEWKRALYQMWFSFYRRDGQNDSCGFEHVFLGELDSTSGEVSGFHNWMQFWLEEEKGAVDYMGYIHPRNRGERVDDNDRCLAVQFNWRGKMKNVTTLFIGTSPEFEFALYTLYFLAGQERNNVTIQGYELCIRCYAIRSKYGNKVGSAFPELLSEINDTHG